MENLKDLGIPLQPNVKKLHFLTKNTHQQQQQQQQVFRTLLNNVT